MAAVEDDFESWLSLKLKALNTDEGVFGSYIKGILDGDESVDEKTEALEEILTEITETDIPVHCREILDRWKSCHLTTVLDNEAHTKSLENVEEKLIHLIESNAPSTTVHRNYTEEERKIREAILAQYSQTSDKESDIDEDDGKGGGGGGGGGGSGEAKENGLFKNTNAAAVQLAEKEKREKAKLDSQKKKEKDREDREKQKKDQQERKEKRKTQKGERRR